MLSICVVNYYRHTGASPYALLGRDEKYRSLAKGYWSAMPLPKGVEIVGGFSDEHRAGALIKLLTGVLVCGNAGSISTISQSI